MTKIKTLPKTISVKIEKDTDTDYLVADPDALGLALAQDGETVRVGIYKLDHVRDVVLKAESIPVTKPR